MFNMRAQDDRGYLRTLYGLPRPKYLFGSLATLRTLCVDSASWVHLLELVVLPTVEDLTIFGNPFWTCDEISGHVRIPALKNVTVYVGRDATVGLGPNEWTLEDVECFLDEHIADYSHPLEKLVIKGGVLAEDYQDEEQGEPMHHLGRATEFLKERARVVEISVGEIR